MGIFNYVERRFRTQFVSSRCCKNRTGHPQQNPAKGWNHTEMVQQRPLGKRRKKTYKLNVIGTANGDSWSFLYASSIFIHKDNAEELQNEVCRERWKIENQGFREQKHCGLALEKAFGTIGFAAQNFYLIVQITHMIRTLMIHNSLSRTIQKIDSHGIIKKTIRKPMLDFFGSI